MGSQCARSRAGQNKTRGPMLLLSERRVRRRSAP
ncbi:hypothetical protein Mpe_A3829 [Methylibium petroleiphilum PM1]|uniref:Uncharacterized protein n=1 Tax=Methylibium petroleiphilum (strain ATCC BAA-1232 / LMG 22953 / PM1) TaxID=420662 RepID=A2SIZ9_METPP|nr:hypothetical protein Mpe_A3829 [Methylibium petroleiphilum PM1]